MSNSQSTITPDIKKEFYTLPDNKPTIGLLMMVKNEEKRIHVSLESISDFVEALIIYDTGSTDKTIDIITEFSEKHKINLYIKKGEFVDFAVSRNVSLDLADTVNVRYILLLDCNDELRGGKELQKLAENFYDKENTGFLLCQQWWCGQLDKYFNIRLVKNRKGWRYRGSVHEWLKDTTSDTDQPRYPVVRVPDIIHLYQDRTLDDDKTGKRFFRDRELLLREYKANPTDPRTLFYLAQTCHCLKLFDEALFYSKLRLEQEGFLEEKFHSYLRCGNSCFSLGHDWSDIAKWYLLAYEKFDRAEPLVKLADYYRNMAMAEAKNNKPVHNLWKMAYMYAHQACELEYPEHCILFVDKGIYDYFRWHLMGIIGFYANKFEEGKSACEKAIKYGINKEINEKNLQFYLNAEKEAREKKEKTENVNKENKDINNKKNDENKVLTRAEFVEAKMQQLRANFPTSSEKELKKKAEMHWKKERTKRK